MFDAALQSYTFYLSVYCLSSFPQVSLFEHMPNVCHQFNKMVDGHLTPLATAITAGELKCVNLLIEVLYLCLIFQSLQYIWAVCFVMSFDIFSTLHLVSSAFFFCIWLVKSSPTTHFFVARDLLMV